MEFLREKKFHCTYGAVVSDSGIEYFEFTEGCDVKKVSSIDSPLDTSLERIELSEELEKFVQSRQGVVAPGEN